MRQLFVCLLLLNFLISGCKDNDQIAGVGATVEVDWPTEKRGTGRHLKEWTPGQLTNLGWDSLRDWPKRCGDDEQLTKTWLLVDDSSRPASLGLLLGSNRWPAPPFDSVGYNGSFLCRWPSNERDTIFGWRNAKYAYLTRSRATIEGLVDRKVNNRRVNTKLPVIIPDSAEYYLLPRGATLFPAQLNITENTLGLLLLSDGRMKCFAKSNASNRRSGPPADWLSVLPASVDRVELGVGPRELFRAVIQMGEGQLIGTKDVDLVPPTSSRNYLNIPVWRENENHFGLAGGQNKAFWYYADVDGVSWQAAGESVLFQLIRRSFGASNRLIELPEIKANLAQLAEAEWIIMGQLSFHGRPRTVWVYAENDQLTGFHAPPTRLANLPYAERDLGGQLSYLEVDPHVGIWLGQTLGGRVWVGDESGAQSIGFQGSVLAGPFSPDGLQVIWQTREHIYSRDGGRLDSVAVASEWPIRFHYASVESRHYILIVDTLGQLRRLEETLSIDPNWKTEQSIGRIMATPAILTGIGSGAQYLGLSEDGAILGWKNRGGLAWEIDSPAVRLPEKSWLRSSLSLAAHDDLSVYVSQNDPDRPLYFTGNGSNSLAALPGRRDSIFLVDHRGNWRKQSVPDQGPIKGTMVIPAESDGGELILLKREADIIAIDTTGAVKWKWPSAHPDSRLFRTGGGRYWGEYEKEKGIAHLFRGTEAMVNQGVPSDVQPVYDSLNDYWILSRNGLLLFVKDLEGYAAGE